MMEKLVVENLTVAYEKNGAKTIAVQSLSFSVRANELVCLLGPTGCGKTTTINAIAGFVKPEKGIVSLDGSRVTQPTKKIGVVFQHHALFPWKTVRENIELGPKLNGVSEEKRKKLAQRYLRLIGLTNYADYYPSELSGGMQQRVGVVRALANAPELVLMDEPFGSIDALTRAQMQEMLLEIWKKSKKTIVFVTHDVDEALLLGDRILVMTRRPGRIRAEIRNVLPKPRNREAVLSAKYLRQKREVIRLLR